MSESDSINTNFAKIFYEAGRVLIEDDAHDIGFTSYHGRTSHKYRGKPAPHHPEPFHHWQVGSLLVLFSQLMALGAVASEAMEDINMEDFQEDV